VNLVLEVFCHFFFVSRKKFKLSPQKSRKRAAAVTVKKAQHNCKMADSTETRINLAALKRVDPYAVEILETGTQVAIYKFSNQSNEWVSSVTNPLQRKLVLKPAVCDAGLAFLLQAPDMYTQYSKMLSYLLLIWILVFYPIGQDGYRRHFLPICQVSCQNATIWLHSKKSPNCFPDL